jgi:hypothetical protein
LIELDCTAGGSRFLHLWRRGWLVYYNCDNVDDYVDVDLGPKYPQKYMRSKLGHSMEKYQVVGKTKIISF